MTTILLVDNEPGNTSVLRMGLEDEGFKVDSFNDPILALSILSLISIRLYLLIICQI
jgi:DNA-binding response OmpR family regulator